jgi:hypothetical protein
MSVGGSHTNFNVDAFTVGAVGGAASLGAALIAGVQNVERQRQAQTVEQQTHRLQCMLDLSEMLREKGWHDLQRERQINADLRLALKLSRARAIQGKR